MDIALSLGGDAGMTLLTVELPWPDARLNPNQSKGRHWAGASALRKNARSDAFVLTRAAMKGPPTWPEGEVALTVVFVQPDKRQRDRDNLLAACKPALDGLADALGINDSQFEPVTIRRQFGAKPGCVIVTVTV